MNSLNLSYRISPDPRYPSPIFRSYELTIKRYRDGAWWSEKARVNTSRNIDQYCSSLQIPEGLPGHQYVESYRLIK